MPILEWFSVQYSEDKWKMGDSATLIYYTCGTFSHLFIYKKNPQANI